MQHQQQGQKQQQDDQRPLWVFRLRGLALRCLQSLAHNRRPLQRLLVSPRGSFTAASPAEQSAAAMAECLLALLSPELWQRSCGQASGGALLAGTLDFLARRGPLFLLLQQLLEVLPVHRSGEGPPPLGEALVTQAAVRCLALQPQQQQQQHQAGGHHLGLLALACTPGLWQRCPSLLPAGPQVILRALAEAAPLEGAAELAQRLPGERDGSQGVSAAALLANLLPLGDRLVAAQQPAVGGHAAGGGEAAPSVLVTAALLALLALLPERVLPQQLQLQQEGQQSSSPLAAAAAAAVARRPSDDGDSSRQASPLLPQSAAAADCGRLPWPAQVPVDSFVARQLSDLGGDVGLSLLRRLVTVELPATAAPATAAGGGGTPVPPERAWQLCKLVWVVLSSLSQVQRLRTLLVLGVSAQLPARVWFNLLQPMQRAAAASVAAREKAAVSISLLALPRPEGPLGGARAAWHDPGWQVPLVVFSQALSSFISTADASDLETALQLSEIYDGARPALGVLPLLRQTLWQAVVTEGDQAPAAPAATALRRAFAVSAGALLAQLAERNHRLEFCPAAAFVADGFSSERFQSEAAAVQLRLGEGGKQRLAQLLAFAPGLVPFQVRWWWALLLALELQPSRCPAPLPPTHQNARSLFVASMLTPTRNPQPPPHTPTHRTACSCCSMRWRLSARPPPRPSWPPR